jgi:hypothetical protein
MEIYQPLAREWPFGALVFRRVVEVRETDAVTVCLCMQITYIAFIIQCCAFINLKKALCSFLSVLAGDSVCRRRLSVCACVRVCGWASAVPGYRKNKRCLKCHMRGTNNVRPFINREKPTSGERSDSEVQDTLSGRCTKRAIKWCWCVKTTHFSIGERGHDAPCTPYNTRHGSSFLLVGQWIKPNSHWHTNCVLSLLKLSFWWE